MTNQTKPQIRLIAASAALIASCGADVASQANAPTPPAQADSRPELVEITPSFGPAGIAYPLQVTLRGSRFLPNGNSVTFGPVTTSGLTSTDGVRITFQVPKFVPGRGGIPPLVLTPGAYDVTVTTDTGGSDALVFTLTRDP